MNSTLTGKKILLAEDEQGVREALRIMLNIDNHTVTEAVNGDEAFKLFEAETYDLVITDYAMPGMQGDKLVENIKNVAPTQPVILATGQAEKFLPSGKPADAVIGKPFSFGDLQRLISRLLSKSAISVESS